MENTKDIEHDLCNFKWYYNCRISKLNKNEIYYLDLNFSVCSTTEKFIVSEQCLRNNNFSEKPWGGKPYIPLINVYVDYDEMYIQYCIDYDNNLEIIKTKRCVSLKRMKNIIRYILKKQQKEMGDKMKTFHDISIYYLDKNPHTLRFLKNKSKSSVNKIPKDVYPILNEIYDFGEVYDSDIYSFIEELNYLPE